MPFPESGKAFGKLRNLMNSFNLFARRDEVSRDTAPAREETAVTPSSASRPTLSSGENPQEKERNVFGEGLRIDGDVSSDTDIVTTVWLRQADGTPFLGEIAVDGETILTVRFTKFGFCDTITDNS